MSEVKRNDWEQPIDPKTKRSDKGYNLENIYEHAHSELSLQQSKRDQIITIYLALCSFLIPFALGEQLIQMRLKGAIFLVIGIIGVLFSLIVARYKEYKDVYWLCCQTLTVLLTFSEDSLDKATVQQTFHHCLKKKGKGYLKEKNGSLTLRRGLFFKKNLYSAETLHFMIIDLMAAFICGLGVALMLGSGMLSYLLIGLAVGVFVMSVLLAVFFKTCRRIYAALEVRADDASDDARRNRAFNKVFSKAWFLHFYYKPTDNPPERVENLQAAAK